MIPKSARYDPSSVLGSGCPINIVIGARTYGKTYGWLKYGIKNYIKTGHTFGFMRTYVQELKDLLSQQSEPFFKHIAAEFPDYEFRVMGLLMQIRKAPKDETESRKIKWESMGQFLALTKYGSYKGIGSSQCDWIIFDEFIRERGQSRYPPNCVEMLYSIWESFDRDRNVTRIVMLANSAMAMNPYFVEWNIPVVADKESYTRRVPVGDTYIFLDHKKNPDFDEFASDSNVRKLTKGSRYDVYAHGNKYKDITGKFIDKHGKTAIPQSCITYRDKDFTIWLDIFSGNTFVESGLRDECPIFALTKDDMEPNKIMIDRTSQYMKALMRRFSLGQLWFSNDSVRESFLDAMQLCGLR